MKRTAITVGVVLVLLGGAVVFMLGKNDTSNNSPAAASQTATATASTVQGFADIQNAVKGGALLLDVRTPEEFGSGHFANAKNHSLQQLEAGEMPANDKKTAVYVYCRSGNRSAQASTILKNAGFTNVTDLGGVSDVESRGGTLVQ